MRAVLLAALLCFGVTACRAQSAPVKLYSKSYALVIGISKYKEDMRFPLLGNAEKDARAVKELLEKTDFIVTPLYGDNATKENIEEAFNALAAKVEQNDSFLFYFAGHGETQKIAGKDWNSIVPYDATEKASSRIDMEDLEKYSRKMSRAKHQLFILDSCYGGALGESDINKAAGEKIEPNTPTSLGNLTLPTSREVLTAGEKYEKVLDGLGRTDGHSLFTYYLLRALDGGADTFHDGFITFTELQAYLRASYAENETQHFHPATLGGHENGRHFVFRNPQKFQRISVSQTLDTGMSARQTMVLQKHALTVLLSSLHHELLVHEASNLEFVPADTTQTFRGGSQGGEGIKPADQKYDYALELTYSPRGEERFHVVAHFVRKTPNLPEIPQVEGEMSVQTLNFNPLVEDVLSQFASPDLHAHLGEFECTGCDNTIINKDQAEGELRSWLGHITNLKYVKDSDGDKLKDFNISVTLVAVPTDSGQGVQVMVSVNHSDVEWSSTLETAPMESWTAALQKVKKQAEDKIHEWVK
jgi:hypothetical protein